MLVKIILLQFSTQLLIVLVRGHN